jgi:pre-mRNA-splicing factor CWC22
VLRLFSIRRFHLDIFKFDPNFLENEKKYKEIKTEILGDDSDEDKDGDKEGSTEEESSDEEEGAVPLPTFLLHFS